MGNKVVEIRFYDNGDPPSQGPALLYRADGGLTRRIKDQLEKLQDLAGQVSQLLNLYGYGVHLRQWPALSLAGTTYYHIARGQQIILDNSNIVESYQAFPVLCQAISFIQEAYVTAFSEVWLNAWLARMP